MVKFCPECGTKRLVEAKFCFECGYQFISAVSGIQQARNKFCEDEKVKQEGIREEEDFGSISSADDIYNEFFASPENKLKGNSLTINNSMDDQDHSEEDLQRLLNNLDLANKQLSTIETESKIKTAAREMANQAAEKAIEHIKENGVEYAKQIVKTIITKKK